MQDAQEVNEDYKFGGRSGITSLGGADTSGLNMEEAGIRGLGEQRLRDKIVVKPIKRVASTIIATVLHERPNVGEVVAVGPGKWLKSGKLQPMELKVGDKIRFGEFNFPEYIENNIKYLILQEADCAGIIEDETI